MQNNIHYTPVISLPVLQYKKIFTACLWAYVSLWYTFSFADDMWQLKMTPNAQVVMDNTEDAKIVRFHVFFYSDMGNGIEQENDISQIRQRYQSERGRLGKKERELLLNKSLPLSADELQQKKKFMEDIDKLRDTYHHNLRKYHASRLNQNISNITGFLQSSQIKLIEKFYALNGIAIEGEKSAIESFLNIFGASIESVDIPAQVKLDLDISVPAVDIDFWWGESIDGGIYDFGIVDSGVDMSHPALNTHTDIGRPGDTVSSSHGTHVAGIAMSTDAVTRGGAYGADDLVWANANNGTLSGIEWVMINGAEVVNTSLGAGIGADDYNGLARSADLFIEQYDTLISNSAGNEGWDADHTLAMPYMYNDIMVACMDDQNTVNRADDIRRTTSSVGPVPGGRKKPDISAPGTSIWSTNADWETEGYFITKSGTSMAAPHVASAILLLRDQGVNDILGQKAILINSADPWDSNNTENTDDDGQVDAPHWDRSYGWGYMNMFSAWNNRHYYATGSLQPDDGDADDDDYKLYKVNHSDVKATLVWLIRNQSSAVGYQLSDLNLAIYDEKDSGIALATSVSSKDNVEQTASHTGSQAVVKVYSSADTFDGVTSEGFAIAMDQAFDLAVPPGFSVSFSHLPTVDANEQFTVEVTVRNNGDVAAMDNILMVTLPSGFSLMNGNLTRDLGTLSAHQSKTVNFAVRSVNSGGTFKIAAANFSDAYDELYSGSNTSMLTVNSPTSPDLVIQSATVSATVLTPGQSFTATVIVINQGTASSAGSTLRYYLSADANITSTDTQLGTDSMSSLAVGATLNESIPLTAPVVTGSFWIGACVDSVSDESNTQNNCSSAVQLTVTAPVITLAEALDSSGLAWSTDGNAIWYGQNAATFYDNDAAQSGAITHSETSNLTTTIDGPGNLSFYWKVSSESQHDFLRFYIDNIEQSGRISGAIDWTLRSFSIPAGIHALKWAYTKDGSVNSGSDAGWLDKVHFETLLSGCPASGAGDVHAFIDNHIFNSNDDCSASGSILAPKVTGSSGNVVIINGANVNFNAPVILLKPGFFVNLGATFCAGQACL